MSLEWIQARTEMYKMQPESFADKSVRKFKENPLVPIGGWNRYRIRLTRLIDFRSFRLFGHSGRLELRFVELPEGRQADVAVHDADKNRGAGIYSYSAVGGNRNGSREVEEGLKWSG